MTILIVDDNETDRKVLRNILEREGIQTIEAEDGVEALTILERERVEAVICDVIMPNMDGFQFCYELRKSLIHRRLPVVIYTSHFANENMGEISREFGADLFLNKPASAAQILESVRMAREAQSRQTVYNPLKLPEVYKDKKTYSEWLIRKLEEQNDALERSESRYRQLVELSPDGVVVICQGEIVFINGAGAQILGATSTREIEGRQVMDFIHADFKQIIIQRTNDLLHGKIERNPPMEQKLLRLHGGFVDVETMSSSFRYFDKPAILVLVRDITFRKEAERRLRESEFFIRESQMAAFIGSYKYDFQKDVWESSEVLDQIFGIDHGYTHNAEGWLNIVHPEDREMMGRYFKEDVQLKRRPFEKEYRIIRKSDGQTRWVFGLGKLDVDARGDIVFMVGTIQDITARKLAEFRLRESERMLSTLVSNLPGIVYRCKIDPDWTMEYMSEGTLALTGYAPDDFLSRRVTYNSIIHPEDQKKVWDDIQKAIDERRPFQILYRIKTADGDVRWFWEQGRAVLGEDGSPLALEGFITDITDRQKFEMALQRSETNYRMLMEQAADAILIADARGHYVDANASACELFGYTKDELLRKRLGDLSDPSEPPVLDMLLKLPVGIPHMAERKFRRKDGTLLIIEVSGKKLPDGRIQGVYHDTTERKRAEEELRRRETDYRILMEQALDAILVADAQGNYIDANASACELFGFSREELLTKRIGDMRDPTEPSVLSYLLILPIGQSWVSELKFRRKDGAQLLIEVSGKKLPDGRILGVYHDITKRKRAEEDLRRSEAKYRMLMEHAADAVIVSDSVTRRYVDVNGRACELFGRSREELLSMKVGEMAGLAQETAEAQFQKVLAGERLLQEYRIHRPDGTWVDVELNASLLPDGRVYGLFRDITARKSAEEAERTQRELIQKLADLLPAIVYVFDLIERKPVYTNRAAAGILGYSPEALQSMGPGFIRQVMHPDDAALYQERVKKFAVASKSEIIDNEYRLKHSNGTWIHFQCQETIIKREADGRPRLILGIARNTTNNPTENTP